MTARNRRPPATLRAVALVAAAVGAVGSTGFVLYTGRKNPSVILMLLFVVWVVSPFAAFIRISRSAKDWQAVNQIALHAAAVTIIVISLAIYGYVALGPPRPQPAAPFLVVPPVSFALAAIIVWLVSALFVNRHDRR